MRWGLFESGGGNPFHRGAIAALASVIAVTALPAAADTPQVDTLMTFNKLNGWNPLGALAEQGGKLYGVAAGGGLKKHGVIYSIDPTTGAGHDLYSFAAGKGDGYDPQTSPLFLNGTMYGATGFGGAAGAGTLYQFDVATRTETILYSFQGGSNGKTPTGNLAYLNGKLYGVTGSGGVSGDWEKGTGTLFEFDPATGTQTVLHQFSGAATGDGSMPMAGVVAANGKIYGTTTRGGSFDWGTVFEYDPATGNVSIIHSFSATDDGWMPFHELTTANGAVYGDAGYTLFKIDLASDTESTLYTFPDTADENNAGSGLLYQNGILYGTSVGPGTSDSAMIYQFDLASSTYTNLILMGRNQASIGTSALINYQGSFYGTSSTGGSRGVGSVFRYVP